MQMTNHKLHYKMYKDGKHWIFAGLMTATVILTGLAGEVTVHADPTTNNDQTTTSTLLKTSATADSSDPRRSPVDKSTVVQPNDDANRHEDNGAQNTVNGSTGPTVENHRVDKTGVTTILGGDRNTDPTDQNSTGARTLGQSLSTVSPKKISQSKIQRPATAKETVSSTMAGKQTALKPTMVGPIVPEAEPVTPQTIDDWMPDKNLQTAIMKVQGLTSVNQLTPAYLSGLTTLDFQDTTLQLNDYTYFKALKSVKSLAGLQYATNLTSLDVALSLDAMSKWDQIPIPQAGFYDRGSLVDIKALSSLTKLTSLQITDQELADISPLANLTNLTDLELTANRIYDFSPLRNLKKLTTLTTGNQSLQSKETLFLSPNYQNYVMNLPQGYGPDGQKLKLVIPPVLDVFLDANGNPAPQAATGDVQANGTSIQWHHFKTGKGYISADWEDAKGNVLYEYGMGVNVNEALSNATVNIVRGTDGHVLHSPVLLTWYNNQTENLAQFPNFHSVYDELGQVGYGFYGVANNPAVDKDFNVAFTSQPVTITAYFNKKVEMTFKYVTTDANGNEKTLGAPQSQSVLIGQSAALKTPEIAGYRFSQATTAMGTPVTVEGTSLAFTITQPDTVTLHYLAADVAGTVKYRYSDGTTAAPDATVTGKPGAAVTFPASPVIAGYTPVLPTDAQFTTDPTKNVFVVTYTKNPVVTPPVNPVATGRVRVHFQDQQGKQLAPVTILTGRIGDSYQTTAATIAKYQLTGQPTNASGVYTAADQTVTYIYVPLAEGTQNDQKPTVKPIQKPTRPTEQPINSGGQGAQGKQPVSSAKPLIGQSADRSQGHATPVTATATTTATTTTALPQTNDARNPRWAILGLAILGGLSGWFGFRRKRN